MPKKANRQIAIPAALWKALDQLARREGKSMIAVLQDLVTEKRQNQLKREYSATQGYWSKRTKANPKQMTHGATIDTDALLARARTLRRAPKGICLTDQWLNSIRSLRGTLKGMSEDNLREKQ